jgi:molybdate/tungstate transport system ATP-binding protein
LVNSGQSAAVFTVENLFVAKGKSKMIEIKDLFIKFPGFALQDINLSIQDGEFFMLLGPTGAGKTLVLEAIAGIVPITSGHIFVKGREITRLPPEHRGTSIVYQDYALFPHLSVLKNITYGLRYHKNDPKASKKRVTLLIPISGKTFGSC